jgi:AcrR family transcriptional regulator
MNEVDGRRARGQKAREQILTHATDIASTEGLEGLTIGRIAAEAGIGKGNIQILFGDKESLQLATLARATDLYTTMILEPAMREATPLARLLALVDGWFSFVDNRVLPGGCFINAVSSEYRARPGRIRDQIIKHRAGTRSRLRRLISDAKGHGEISPDVDVSQLVFDLVAHQAAANVAALMGDQEEFARARQSSRDRIRAAATSSRLPRLKLSAASVVARK